MNDMLMCVNVQGAYPLEVTALACNFDGTKVALGFKSGTYTPKTTHLSPH